MTSRVRFIKGRKNDKLVYIKIKNFLCKRPNIEDEKTNCRLRENICKHIGQRLYMKHINSSQNSTVFLFFFKKANDPIKWAGFSQPSASPIGLQTISWVSDPRTGAPTVWSNCSLPRKDLWAHVDPSSSVAPPLLWPLLGLQVLIRWLLFPSYLTPCGSLFRAWLVLGLFWPFNLQFVFNKSCSPWGFVFEVSMRGGELCVLFPSHVDLLLRLCSCFSSPFPFLPQSPAPESTPLTDRLNKNPHLRLSFRRTTVR